MGRRGRGDGVWSLARPPAGRLFDIGIRFFGLRDRFVDTGIRFLDPRVT
jgi:hypothetical protein